MKILLTGASGMVGQNILAYSEVPFYSWLCPTHQELDLTCFSTVKVYLEHHQPDFIIHAAGRVAGIQANRLHPVNFLIENLAMGKNLLLAAAQTGVTSFLNLGSSCMYPKDHDKPLVEEDLLTGSLEPTNEGYALAKITVAKLGEYLNSEYPQFCCKTFIPSNIYGPYDKFDPQISHMIPAAIEKIHNAKQEKQKNVTIWGSGKARREFLYVEDLVKAIFRAIKCFDTLPPYTNIGLGEDYSIYEYYKTIAEVIEYKGIFDYDLNMPEGMKRKLTNINKAMQWGWKPETNIKQGIKKTYEYYLKNKKVKI